MFVNTLTVDGKYSFLNSDNLTQPIQMQLFTILVIIFWDILMFDKIYVLPQAKRIVIISNKHGIYELPHELPSDLRLRTLGN